MGSRDPLIGTIVFLTTILVFYVQSQLSYGFSMAFGEQAGDRTRPGPSLLTSSSPTPTPPGTIVINEVVTDPQQDWNDTLDGDGIPFNGTPGSDKALFSDEWIELLNVSNHSIDLTGWAVVMTDLTPATQVLGEAPAVLRFSAGGSLTDFRPGEYLVIGDPKGSLGNRVFIELRDADGTLIDDVEIGDDFEADGTDGAAGGNQNGNALTVYDEAVARVPDGFDSDDDRADFEKRPATIGAPNGVPVERLVELPALNSFTSAGLCESFIDIQNVGTMPTKGIALFWDEIGNCPPDCEGFDTVRCTGLLKPGASWHLGREQVPPDARNGIVFSAFAQSHPAFNRGQDVFADRLCETLRFIRAECNDYLSFRRALEAGGIWRRSATLAYNFAAFPGQPIAVEVTRRCWSIGGPGAVSAYHGIQRRQLGQRDPVLGGFSYYAPLLYADKRGLNSTLYIQNASDACTGVELWFRSQGECLQTQLCDILAIAPGESYRLSVDECVGSNWVGNAWIGTSQPVAIVVDTAGRNVLMTYEAMPTELKVSRGENPPPGTQPADPLFTPGSQVNYGPLIFREFQGWDTRIQVQNLSSVLNAKVKVFFLDQSGNVVHTAMDWICPRGTQDFTLATMGQLPGNWIGQVRIESQAWFAPGGAAVSPPNIVGVAQLVRWNGPEQATPLSGAIYNLLTETQGLDWQLGRNAGGPESGAGLIAIPYFLKAGRAGPEAGLTTELAISNLVPKPGFTDFVIYLYDQNGLLDYVCEKLNEGQVEYIDVADDWDYLQDGFKGSVVISATRWEHPVFDPASGRILRNLLGLGAVKLERLDTQRSIGGNPVGDEASATLGIPLAGPFNPDPDFEFEGPSQPACP